MATYTLKVTAPINTAVSATNLNGQAVADEKIPKDWSAEGALDTSLTTSSKSIQRTGYVNVYKNSYPTLMGITWEVGDNNSTPGLIQNGQMVDAVKAVTAYPGVTIV